MLLHVKIYLNRSKRSKKDAKKTAQKVLVTKKNYLCKSNSLVTPLLGALHGALFFKKRNGSPQGA